MYDELPIGVEVGLLVEDLLAALDPNKPYYNTQDIIYALPHSKLSYLGSGAYGVASSAYLSDGREIVIKLAGYCDDGYPWWADYCKDNPAKHLPEVYYTARAGALHVTAMKRYEPMDQDQEWLVDNARAHGDSAEDPSLAAAIIRVRDMIMELRGGVDMHLGNYMYDPDTGEIVITDPCSFMPPADETISAPRQLALNFEIDNMGTAIDSLLNLVRYLDELKAEELHGEERPASAAGEMDMMRWNLPKLDTAMQQWPIPKVNHFFAMDFANAEARVGHAVEAGVLVCKHWDRKVNNSVVKFMQDKWGNL